jgi:succinate dehydrogenase/fumarate reductase flavoprotein subunit
MDGKTARPDRGFRYQIPYRIIVPEGVKGLLVAGRCASATHEALGSLRVMPQCGVMGQAAGAAAVMSLRAGVAPKDLDAGELQGILRPQGCILTAEDVARANA